MPTGHFQNTLVLFENLVWAKLRCSCLIELILRIPGKINRLSIQYRTESTPDDSLVGLLNVRERRIMGCGFNKAEHC
jgi:hypothetical protein